MTVLLNTLEGGSDGTNITGGNSGGASGDAFTLIQSTPTFEADAAYHDGLGMKCADSTSQTAAGWSGLSSMSQRASCYVKFASVAPSIAIQVLQWRTAGNSIVGSISLNTNGRLIFQHVGGGISTGTNISAHAISANNGYRIDCEITIDPTTSANGVVAYGIYDVNAGDTDTPITTRHSGAASLGTTAADAIRFGPMQNAARNGDWLFDTVRAEGGSTTPFGQYSPPAPDITETFTDNLALIEATDGTPPFSIAQDSGTSTTPEELDDGSSSGTGRWLVAKHSTDTLTYTVTDAAAVDSDPYNVPPISPANTQLMRPTPGDAPGTTWI